MHLSIKCMMHVIGIYFSYNPIVFTYLATYGYNLWLSKCTHIFLTFSILTRSGSVLSSIQSDNLTIIGYLICFTKAFPFSLFPLVLFIYNPSRLLLEKPHTSIRLIPHSRVKTLLHLTLFPQKRYMHVRLSHTTVY